MATILWSSGTAGPAVPGPLMFPHFDKVGHFLVFGLIATLIYRAVPHWVEWRKAAFFAVAMVSFFGFMDEFRQSFNPGRSPSVLDWMADTLGGLVAVAAYRFWPFYRNLLERSLNPFKKDRHGGRYRSQTY